MKKCIVCEKEIIDTALFIKNEVFFCSEQCLADYEEKLKKLSEIVDWDNCC